MNEEKIIKEVLKSHHFKELNPVQSKAIQKGLLAGKNLVVSSPTSSGKTLIAEMAGLNIALNQKKKMVYLCPLVALAREKYEEFKKKYERLGIKVALSVGDYDSVKGNQKVFLKIGREFRIIEIGKITRRIFKQKGFRLIKGKEICENEDEIFGYTFNPTSGKIELTKIQAFIRHKVKKPIYEIQTRSGRKISVTSDHSLFVLDEENIIRSIKASELEAGKSYIAVPKFYPEEKGLKEINLLNYQKLFKGSHVKGKSIQKLLLKIWDKLDYKKYPQKYRWKKHGVLPINLFVKFKSWLEAVDFRELKFQKGGDGICSPFVFLDEDFLNFLGLWVADGCYNGEKGIRISGGSDKNCKNLVKRVAKKFNLSLAEVDEGETLVMTGSFLIRIMRDILNFKGKAKTKRIPSIVFSLSNKQIAAFLRGYFSGDGTVNRGEVCCSSSSVDLLYDIQTLLLRLRIISRIKKDKLKIPRKWSVIFKKEIGFLQKNQNKKIVNLSHLSYYESIPFSKEFMKKNFFEHDYYTGKSLPTLAYLTNTLLPKLSQRNKIAKEKIEKIISCDLLWDKVIEIKKRNFKGYVYDLSVPPFENFICENFLVKNSSDPWLEKYNFVCLSNEKMDSLIRHGAQWINQIGLIVVDEIHLLNDFSRGPTLEILITLLRELVPKAQILALSATIKNCREIADWLGGELLKSDFRPVPLYQGVFWENKINLSGKKIYILKPGLPPEELITENTLSLKKQLIFFLSTRRNAEALAERLSKLVIAYLDLKERGELEKLAQKIEGTLEIPTWQCKKLANCIRGGVAFYHAGLVSRQKILIEEAYKNRILKVITSTTSLAMGVNLPNFRSVVRDIKRFYPGIGSAYIPVLEVQQMFGRSGRPQFDKWGEGILIAKNKKEEKELERIYLKGELEEISSKISNEMALRMHILAQISNGFSKTKEELREFFSKTFFGFKFKSIYFLEEKIEKILELLESWKFIKRIEIMKNHEPRERLLPTKLGKRISELYLDPFSASQFIEGLKFPKIKNFPLLCLICRASELKPSLNLGLRDIPEIEKFILKYEKEFLLPLPDQFEEEYEEFLREAKLALVFGYWIEEKTEGEILEKFNVTPGELHQRLQIADWLLYSFLEIGKIIYLGREKMRKLRELRKRLYYGIRGELLNLVKLEGIGRIRARALFKAGFKRISDLKKADIETITKIIKNRSVAERIKETI